MGLYFRVDIAFYTGLGALDGHEVSLGKLKVF